MRITSAARGGLALAVVAAAVFVIGIGVGTADAQATGATVDGAYAVTAGAPAQLTGGANIGALAEAYWFFSDGESARGLVVTRTFYAPGV